MDRRIISWCLSLSLMLLIGGCAGKKVGSSSGDQSSQSGQAKSEAIKPDVIATVPVERSFDRSSGNPTTPSGNVPADLSSSTQPGPLAGKALGDIFFDFDRFQIRKDAMPVLEANARWFRANTNKTVLIEGHCDERGTLAYNLVLGEKRARAAKNYLQDLGVLASQLQITSYGETRPFCKQHNEDCYQQNRRAHFVTK